MPSIKDNDVVVSMRFQRENGVNKISFRDTRRKTKAMVGYDIGVSPSKLSVRHNLSDDLNYSKQDKKDLKVLIENSFFSHVFAVADKNDLAKATTVGDLAKRIFFKYIPPANRLPL